MMTDAVTETHIFGQVPDTNENIYQLKNIGKTLKIFTRCN